MIFGILLSRLRFFSFWSFWLSVAIIALIGLIRFDFFRNLNRKRMHFKLKFLTLCDDIDSASSIGKVAKENLHTMTEELKAFEQERKRRKATESQG